MELQSTSTSIIGPVIRLPPGLSPLRSIPNRPRVGCPEPIPPEGDELLKVSGFFRFVFCQINCIRHLSETPYTLLK